MTTINDLQSKTVYHHIFHFLFYFSISLGPMKILEYLHLSMLRNHYIDTGLLYNGNILTAATISDLLKYTLGDFFDMI